MAVKTSFKKYKVKNAPPELGFGADIGAGALNGASTGFSIGGPWGAAAGAAVGGTFGWLKAKKDKERQDALDKELAANKAKNLRSVNAVASQAILQNFPTQGIERPMMGKGGNTPKLDGTPDYIAEGGEVVAHNPLNTPATDKSGSLERLSAGLSKINGSKHASSKGGVAMKGGERVYSDQVPIPKNFIKVLKKL